MADSTTYPRPLPPARRARRRPAGAGAAAPGAALAAGARALCRAPGPCPGGSSGPRDARRVDPPPPRRRRSTSRELSHAEQLGTCSDPAAESGGRELATGYLGLVPADVDPPAPRRHRLAPGGPPARARLRPRRARAGRPRAAARQAFVHERRVRAGAARVHDLGAARPLRRRARSRGLGDELEARSPAARRARGGRRPARPRAGGRSPGGPVPLPHPTARHHRSVRGPEAAAYRARHPRKRVRPEAPNAEVVRRGAWIVSERPQDDDFSTCFARLVLAATLLALVLPGSAVATSAGAYVAFDGGSVRERAQVRAALQTSSFDWAVVQQQTTVHIGTYGTSYSTPGHVWLDARPAPHGQASRGRPSWTSSPTRSTSSCSTSRAARSSGEASGPRPGATSSPSRPLALGRERFASMVAWAYWPSKENAYRPRSRTDETAAMPAPAFRALLADLIGAPLVLATR